MKNYKAFIFESYEFDKDKNLVELNYSLDGELKFKEIIHWELSAINYDTKVLDSALFGLWIMCGISYFKTYLPRKIIIKRGELTKQQADFFNKTYTKGLAQFFYTNQLDWQEIINFEPTKSNILESKSVVGDGCISAIGGGKDSIVAAEILKALKIHTECWSVNQADRFTTLCKRIGLKNNKVSRVLDPLLTKLNAEDAYNGHVPITAINSFIGVILAILIGKTDLVFAIEGTAEESSTNWKGLDVNHQYSKTLEFEKDMQEYIHKNIAVNLQYYSILRPLTELRIADIFIKNYFEEYKNIFSSCNANYTFGNSSKLNWCGKCPKCAFVFVIFSPFLKKTDLLKLFGGKNIYDDEEMLPTIEELLGISGHKPLECVGEIAETRLAVQMAKETKNYPELSSLKFPEVNYNYKKWIKNSLPIDLEVKLKKYVNSL